MFKNLFTVKNLKTLGIIVSLILNALGGTSIINPPVDLPAAVSK